MAETCGSVHRYRVYRTTREGNEQFPAQGGWEVDMARLETGGGLMRTEQVLAARKAAMMHSPVSLRKSALPELGR